jgi:hypothetical protein
VNTPAKPEPSSLTDYCTQNGRDLPRRFLVDLPQAILELSAAQRHRRAACTENEAVLDECRFFARGELTIPVQDGTEPFCYDCWIELPERNHLVLISTDDHHARDSLAPLPGHLANCLPPFYDTMGIEALLVVRPLGSRSQIVLRSPSRMTGLQQDGLTPAECTALSIDVMHGRLGAFASLSQ